ncbi:MAG: hypothetical protein J3K34DRAFT_433216 [Monoraphidium minutum]|nr:MAG: hypothetical protein J3K34DRAFT_433216 [Monoraphidium minutum]
MCKAHGTNVRGACCGVVACTTFCCACPCRGAHVRRERRGTPAARSVTPQHNHLCCTYKHVQSASDIITIRAPRQLRLSDKINGISCIRGPTSHRGRRIAPHASWCFHASRVGRGQARSRRRARGRRRTRCSRAAAAAPWRSHAAPPRRPRPPAARPLPGPGPAPRGPCTPWCRPLARPVP